MRTADIQGATTSGFGVMAKNTLAFGQEEPGIEPRPFGLKTTHFTNSHSYSHKSEVLNIWSVQVFKMN